MQKVLLYDLETSPLLGWTWETYETNVLSVEKNRELMSFAYKWLGDKTVRAYSLKDLTPKQLTGKLHELFNEADITIGHNGDSFDKKMANTFFIRHGFGPPKPAKSVDTLKIARSRFRFHSNKLNDLGEYLGLGRKLSTGGFSLWLSCLKGDKKAWDRMVKYNKQDVVLLEKVYLKLRSWGNHPERPEHGLQCPVCASTNVQMRGWNVNRVYKSKRFQCRSCGKWGTSNIRVRHHSGEYLKAA
jgi:hypothetical protein